MNGAPITERGVRYVLNDVVKRTAGVTDIHPINSDIRLQRIY